MSYSLLLFTALDPYYTRCALCLLFTPNHLRYLSQLFCTGLKMETVLFDLDLMSLTSVDEWQILSMTAHRFDGDAHPPLQSSPCQPLSRQAISDR